MIYHQVRFSIKADAPKEKLAHSLKMLRRMGREIEVVEFWLVGRDFGGEFEYGAMYALKDIEAYDKYMNAPIHRATDEAGLPIVDKFVSLDLTDDEDPAIGEKIAEIHRKRYASDRALVDLVEGLGGYQGSGTSNIAVKGTSP